MKPLAALLCLVSSIASADFSVHFVDVGDGVKVEVLYWGGSGTLPPTYMQSPGGATVLPASPNAATSVPELAEDVWRIIVALKITKPVVVGHSMAGSEITYLGQMHSTELGGLIYLDANGDPPDHPWSNQEYRTLVMKSMKDASSDLPSAQTPIVHPWRRTRHTKNASASSHFQPERFARSMRSVPTERLGNTARPPTFLRQSMPDRFPGTTGASPFRFWRSFTAGRMI